jgi:hypothetical protein
MRTFRCDVCGLGLYFENSECTKCGSILAFLPDARVLAAVADAGDGQLRCCGQEEATYRHCKNRTAYAACNWAVPIQDAQPLCESCRLNDMVPDLTQDRSLDLWKRMEAAKRRLLYTLRDLGLSDFQPAGEGEHPLRFKFLADVPGAKHKVLTGHANGVITINLSEADSSRREAVREALGEGYRTLLGHFRHESGHYWWDRLIAPNPERLESFRALFGDERSDYATALEQHYAKLDGAACPEGYLSAYATMHPWEDWAETWAHYLHMVDTLQTAGEYGLTMWRQPGPAEAHDEVRASETNTKDFDDLIGAWTALTIALNSLNRSMGIHDVYPFALSSGALEKLRHVHTIITEAE